LVGNSTDDDAFPRHLVIVMQLKSPPPPLKGDRHIYLILLKLAEAHGNTIEPHPPYVSFCLMKKERRWESCQAHVQPRMTS
jgi:hypothetical protein